MAAEPPKIKGISVPTDGSGVLRIVEDGLEDTHPEFGLGLQYSRHFRRHLLRNGDAS